MHTPWVTSKVTAAYDSTVKKGEKAALLDSLVRKRVCTKTTLFLASFIKAIVVDVLSNGVALPLTSILVKTKVNSAVDASVGDVIRHRFEIGIVKNETRC